MARAKLESRTRQPNEKVQDLTSDILNLTCKSYPDFSLEYQELIGLEALKRALGVQLRLRLTDFKAATVESIMAADVQQKCRYSARAMTAHKGPATEGEMDVVKKLDQLTQQLQQLKKPHLCGWCCWDMHWRATTHASGFCHLREEVLALWSRRGQLPPCCGLP